MRLLILAAVTSVVLAGCATSDRKAGVALISPPPLKARVMAPAPEKSFVVSGLTLEWDECRAPTVPVFYEVFDRQSLDDPWALFATTTNRYLRVEPLYEGFHVFAVRGAWIMGGVTNYTPFATGICPPAE